MLYIYYIGSTPKQIMKILKANGWKKVRIDSSHHVFEKEGFDRPVPVPLHGNKDLGNFGNKILKEAGINPKTLKEESK